MLTLVSMLRLQIVYEVVNINNGICTRFLHGVVIRTTTTIPGMRNKRGMTLLACMFPFVPSLLASVYM